MKGTKVVTPAKAGVQNHLLFLDSGFRRNDGKGRFRTFASELNFVFSVRQDKPG